jgi:hypothetical protein
VTSAGFGRDSGEENPTQRDYFRPKKFFASFQNVPILAAPEKTVAAGVAELVDASDSKSDFGNRVWVRFPPPAPAFRGASSLSDLGLIYCGGGKLVHFSDPFRQIATAILLKRSKNCPRLI